MSVLTEGRFEVTLHQEGLLRALTARELSEGTLRFVLLATALLSPRPPSLLVLNEPETSLHASVLPAVARLIAAAAKRCQVVVVTHSRAIIDALTGDDDLIYHELVKELGATTILGQGLLTKPQWNWGSR